VNGRNRYSLAAMWLLGAALAGCSSLHGQGPSGFEIVQQGTASDPELAPRFLITNLNDYSVSVLEHAPVASLYHAPLADCRRWRFTHDHLVGSSRRRAFLRALSGCIVAMSPSTELQKALAISTH
jgi:hypothetical protein